jgi:hypothetical protein
MCQSDTNRERFLQSFASDEERRSIAAARKALLSAPDCFAGIAVWGYQPRGKTMFMSLAQIKRADVRSDAALFEEVFINYELVTMEMREDGTWPCLEFLETLQAFSNFNVVRVFKDGSFERWRIADVLQAVRDKQSETRRRRSVAATTSSSEQLR